MNFAIPRRVFLLSALSAAALKSARVQAQSKQNYPTKPVTMVVAFAAGGPIDLATRIVADWLSKKLGQPFVVENRTGANGAIAADYVKASAPDGYTMLVSNASMITITPTLKKNLSYDVKRDFAPVSRIASSSMILVVNPEDPATKDIHSVKDLVAAAKAAPEKYSYGSAGINGNVQQVAFELLASQADISLLSVPYKGSSEVQAALLSRTITLAFDTLTAVPYIKTGKMRPLAVSSSERVAQIPDVPTMQELGFPDFDIGFWSGVFMPKKTPQPIVEKISNGIVEACQDPEVRKRLELLGAVVASSPSAFQAHIEKETAMIADVLRRAHIKPD